MTFASLIAWLPLLLGFTAAPGEEEPRVRSVMIHDEWIVRIPVRPRLAPPAIDWIERKGDKCLPVRAIRGAMLSGQSQVDFLLVDRTRMRARLSDDCPTLDFYGGFYLKPEDEMLCARRDFIHSRIGGSCQIEKFRRLEPKLHR